MRPKLTERSERKFAGQMRPPRFDSIRHIKTNQGGSIRTDTLRSPEGRRNVCSHCRRKSLLVACCWYFYERRATSN